MSNQKMIVKKIDNQGDRLVMYGSQANYHVIASIKEADNLKEGDEIEYEPYGANFGWFVKKVKI